METLGIVSITVPNFLHREIGSAFAAAGKHIWIEKPVGLSAADARAIVGDGQVTVGFNFRSAPAVETARDLIAGGEIGRVTHARVRLFSDYAAHPQGALSWTRRCAPSSSGPGRRVRSVPARRRKRDLKVIEAARFLRSVEDGAPRGATLADAIASAEALDAMSRSAETGAWVTLPR